VSPDESAIRSSYPVARVGEKVRANKNANGDTSVFRPRRLEVFSSRLCFGFFKTQFKESQKPTERRKFTNVRLVAFDFFNAICQKLFENYEIVIRRRGSDRPEPSK
jgi:hypothetical protein